MVYASVYYSRSHFSSFFAEFQVCVFICRLIAHARTSTPPSARREDPPERDAFRTGSSQGQGNCRIPTG
jgi:hypothetical protein